MPFCCRNSVGSRRKTQLIQSHQPPYIVQFIYAPAFPTTVLLCEETTRKVLNNKYYCQRKCCWISCKFGFSSVGLVDDSLWRRAWHVEASCEDDFCKLSRGGCFLMSLLMELSLSLFNYATFRSCVGNKSRLQLPAKSIHFAVNFEKSFVPANDKWDRILMIVAFDHIFFFFFFFFKTLKSLQLESLQQKISICKGENNLAKEKNLLELIDRRQFRYLNQYKSKEGILGKVKIVCKGRRWEILFFLDVCYSL
jgi:hypothetical protein